MAAIFRLDTACGGGKTHGLIALAQAAKSLTGVPYISEFLDENLLPSGPVRVTAFDGENSDPAVRSWRSSHSPPRKTAKWWLHDLRRR